MTWPISSLPCTAPSKWCEWRPRPTDCSHLSEIVGLVPERALYEAAARHIQLRGFTPALVLDRRVREAVAGGETVTGFTAAVASPVPAPGGGSVAAHVGALGAALAQMVAGLTVGRKKYASAESEMKELGLKAAKLVTELQSLVVRDAKAYEAVTTAYKLPKDTDEQVCGADHGDRQRARVRGAGPLEMRRPVRPLPSWRRSGGARARTPRQTASVAHCWPRRPAGEQRTTSGSTCRQ
jgi:hypothetical protein